MVAAARAEAPRPGHAGRAVEQIDEFACLDETHGAIPRGVARATVMEHHGLLGDGGERLFGGFVAPDEDVVWCGATAVVGACSGV